MSSNLPISWTLGLACLLFASIALRAQGLSGNEIVPSSAAEVCPLKPGVTVPDVAVADLEGHPTSIIKILAGTPSVVVFYRGGWCPYCNLQLAALQGIEEELEKKGIQLIAISADRPSKLRESLSRHQLGYRLYSDSSMQASKAFGIAFRVDEATVERYRSRSMDLEEASGERHHLLPVPSVFLVDAAGLVTFTYVNPNHRVRLSPETLRALISSMSERELLRQ